MPQQRGSRSTIAPYVYLDLKGISAIAYVKGRRPKEKRFPLGTALSTIQAWQKAKRKELSAEAASQKRLALPGTIGAAIVAYLATIVDSKARAASSLLLAPWLAAIGSHSPTKITALILQRQLNEWAAGGRAPSTLNHRRRELAKVWALAYPTAPNIVRQVPRAKEPERADRAQDVHLMDAILDEIPDTVPYGQHRRRLNKAKGRLKVLLWTGFPPATQGRLQPHAIDLERQEVRLPPRQKGAGARAVTVPLFPQGVDALRVWLKAKAQGAFSRSSLRKTFTRAVERYLAKMQQAGTPVALPHDLHPYDLRHSFLSWAYEQTGDPLVVQLLAQHVSLATTRHYTHTAIERRARLLVHGPGAESGPKEIRLQRRTR